MVTRSRVSLGRNCRSLIIPQWSVKVCFCIQEVNHILTKSLLLEHETCIRFNFSFSQSYSGNWKRQNNQTWYLKKWNSISLFFLKKVIFSLFHCQNNIQFSSYHCSQALQNEYNNLMTLERECKHVARVVRTASVISTLYYIKCLVGLNKIVTLHVDPFLSDGSTV